VITRLAISFTTLSPVIPWALLAQGRPSRKQLHSLRNRLRAISIVRTSKARFTTEETYAWLEQQMAKQGFATLEELAQASGIDRGTLSRYFRQERRPSVDVIAPLYQALEVAPENLLIALGAVDRRG
jgi:Cro/C1-type HTH DNA-binding domain